MAKLKGTSTFRTGLCALALAAVIEVAIARSAIAAMRFIGVPPVLLRGRSFIHIVRIVDSQPAASCFSVWLGAVYLSNRLM
jgi:hypothetical protein